MALGTRLDAFSMLLSMFLHQLLILGLINLLGALLMCLGHLLSHYLSESIVGTLRVEPFLLWLLFFLSSLLLLALLLNLLEVWFWENTFRVWLPIGFIEF